MTIPATPPQSINIANAEAPSPTAATAAASSAPTPPAKPDPTECCGTGCIPCVMDIYEEQLWQYEKDLKVWQAAQLPSKVD